MQNMKQETRQRRGRPWLQELTYGRTCSRSAECKPAWRCSRFIATLTLMLLLLTAGGSQAWANTSWDKTNTDEGGGTYKYKGEAYYSLSSAAENQGYLKTAKRFDTDQDQFYWDFEVRAYMYYGYNNAGFGIYTSFDGEIYLVTGDNVSHLVGTWKSDREDSSHKIYTTVKDETWGAVGASATFWGDTNFSAWYRPNSRAFQDGVKAIILKQYAYNIMYHPGSSGCIYWTQYEKSLDLSSIAADKPMPKPTVEWGTDGRLAFKAAGMPDKRKNSKYGSQGYVVDVYYYENGQQSSTGNGFTTGSNNMTFSNESNGKVDASFNFWPLTQQTEYAKAAYTVPAYVDYYGYVRLNKDAGGIVPDRLVLSQPKVTGVLVKPFTRPVTVSVEFDKWSKKNTVKWTRQTSTKGFNGQKVVNVDCRYDGKWYVIRYAKGGKATDYKLIGTLSNDVSTLQATDSDIDYDWEYVYRVVFLPSILESAYKDHLATLPGYSGSHTNYDLWEEREVSTKLEVNIRLQQDMAYTQKVRLRWQYSIPQTGLTWYIDYKPTNGQTWQERTETIPVDANQTEATADFNGSVCDAVTYRVKTKIGGQYVYSDTLSARLSTGSFIRNVKATTGTEQTAVKVEWDVENADPTNKIAYLVRRRPVGTDEWTTVSDSIKDTKEHYEWTDTRPQTGTYYEYTVEAYGTVCAEQVEQSRMDGIVVPGFSQARGTITGHIAYGSGTAVQGARVNLVKSSADQESDQVQYLSRYIEGAGKGLVWQAEGEKYANLLCGSQPATLQLWAKPASDGSSHYLRPKRQQNDTI